MPRITKITTRRGDDGFTDLAGGIRVRKDSKRIHAIGSLDELNSALGVARSQKPQPATDRRLREIQNDLLCIGAMLSRKSRKPRTTGAPGFEVHSPEILEQESAELQRRLGPLENFLLPGGTPSASSLQFARAVCRRAEREVVALSRSETIDPLPRLYLNRLSDLLFQYARLENRSAGFPEQLWNSR
jgi:cob(I)alamin adenosyltransferase